MRKLGEDVSEMLDFVPGYFKVIRHIRLSGVNQDENSASIRMRAF